MGLTGETYLEKLVPYMVEQNNLISSTELEIEIGLVIVTSYQIWNYQIRTFLKIFVAIISK